MPASWWPVSIARVYRPPVATVIRPPGQPVGRLGISEQYVSSISSFLGVEQRAGNATLIWPHHLEPF